MSDICPVCGCMTEELDFEECTLAGESIRACSYCRKQLGVIEGSDTLAESSVRWIDNVLLREVPERSNASTAALREMRSRVPAAVPAAPAVTASPYSSAARPPVTAGSVAAGKGDISLKELEERLAKVEHDFYAFKKRLFLMNIAEVVIPVILLIILIIIFLNSGIMDSLNSIISAGTGGAVDYSGGLNLFGRISALTVR